MDGGPVGVGDDGAEVADGFGADEGGEVAGSLEVPAAEVAEEEAGGPGIAGAVGVDDLADADGLDAVEGALGIEEGGCADERLVLRDYGNMSAPTVLFVLEGPRTVSGKLFPLSMTGPIVTCASGNSSCTASAMTCAASWRSSSSATAARSCSAMCLISNSVNTAPRHC